MTYDSEQEEDERFWEEYSAQHHEVFTPKGRLQLPQKLCDPRAALLAVVGGGFALLVCRASRRRKPSQQQRPAAAAVPTNGERRRIVGKRAGGSSEARAEGGSSKARAEGGSIRGDDAYTDAFSEDDGSDGEAGDGDGQASGLLSRSDIDTAAWGALLGGHSTHWAQLCESAQKDCSAPHARRCCRPLPANLKGSGLLVGGHEVLVVDYLHCDLAAHEDELADLGALLDRLGREVFLRGLARPRFRLLYDPSDESWGFVDCQGTLWFNAARDHALLSATGASLGAAALASPTSRGIFDAARAPNGGVPPPAGPQVSRHFDRRRAEAWFLAACHLLAHHWGAPHSPSFDQHFGRVVLRFMPRLAAAFPWRAAA